MDITTTSIWGTTSRATAAAMATTGFEAAVQTVFAITADRTRTTALREAVGGGGTRESATGRDRL